MLTVEEHFVIKDLYRRGVSISEIARRTGHDRKTIRQRLTAPLLAEQAPRAPRACKIDPYVPYLEQRLAEGVLNAHKLFGEIVARGYPGGESQVKAFVQYRRPARQPEATVRFETAPGQQAQVDWGSFGTIAHEGRHRRLCAFVMTLGWSRMLYLEFTLSMEITWFLRGHLHAFAYFGGAPREVLHDNLKTAVLDRAADGTIHWHPRYLDFANYYGFTPRACRPYRAQTKGKVERGIGYVRGNFWPGVHAEGLADLNAQARLWLDTVANVRRHGTTGVVPFTRLPDEGLLPLGGKPPYDTSVVLTRQSTRDGLVSYAGTSTRCPAPTPSSACCCGRPSRASCSSSRPRATRWRGILWRGASSNALSRPPTTRTCRPLRRRPRRPHSSSRHLLLMTRGRCCSMPPLWRSARSPYTSNSWRRAYE
ncbi:MAG TPA: IS21 family transposase [Chloroflexota bacterium]|nr:IS21 family transposase [Chloroflexota bacterium]